MTAKHTPESAEARGDRLRDGAHNLYRKLAAQRALTKPLIEELVSVASLLEAIAEDLEMLNRVRSAQVVRRRAARALALVAKAEGKP